MWRIMSVIFWPFCQNLRIYTESTSPEFNHVTPCKKYKVMTRATKMTRAAPEKQLFLFEWPNPFFCPSLPMLKSCPLLVFIVPLIVIPYVVVVLLRHLLIYSPFPVPGSFLAYFVPKVYCDDTNAVMADVNTAMAYNVEIAPVTMAKCGRDGRPTS